MPPRAVRTLYALIAILLAGPSWAAGECRPPESLTKFGTWFEPDIEVTAAFADRRVDATQFVRDATTMRLQLQIQGGTDRRWHLLIRDSAYHVLASFYPEDFIALDGVTTVSRWTGRLPTATARIDLRADPGSDANVAVIGGIAMPAVPTGERQYSTKHDTPDWRDLFDMRDRPPSTVARRAGDAVGMLLGGSYNSTTGQHTTWCCSGVMVSKSLMLTNWHCGGVDGTRAESYWNKDICANTLFDLGWDSGSVSRQYACARIVAMDRALDFALLRVQPVVGTGGGALNAPYATLAIQEPSVHPDQAVFLIHHALCKPKLLSNACRVRARSYPSWIDPARTSEFTHDCDTEPGASGAPVFDAASGRLVGLHHLGFACASPDKVNKAIAMSQIMDFLVAHVPDAAAELQGR